MLENIYMIHDNVDKNNPVVLGVLLEHFCNYK